MGAPRPVTPLGILTERLAHLDAAVAGLDPALVAQVREAWELARGLDPYVAACTTPESDALARVASRTAEHDWSSQGGPLEQEMLSGHVEGQLLKALVHLSGARRVLEIGMFTGYSALAMAEALPDGGEVVACELDPTAAALAQECFGASPHGNRIEVRLGPALETLQALAGSRFDLVFVDADKAGYADYLRALLDLDLVDARSVVVVDNTLMQGRPWSGEPTDNGRAVDAFNRLVADDARLEQVLLPVRDGVTLIRRVDR